MYIPSHAIAAVIGFSLIALLAVIWVRFARKVWAFLMLVGTAGTIYTATQTDLVPAHLEAVAICGAVLTTLAVALYMMAQSRWRIHRAWQTGQEQQPVAKRSQSQMVQSQPQSQPQPIQFVQEQAAAPRSSRPSRAKGWFPSAEPEVREVRPVQPQPVSRSRRREEYVVYTPAQRAALKGGHHVR